MADQQPLFIRAGQALANLLPASTVRYTGPETPPAEESYQVRGKRVTKSEVETLRKILFGEISNRAPDKQALEARAIANVALNRLGSGREGTTLGQVLSKPQQFQAYNGKEYKRLEEGKVFKTDQPKIQAIDQVLTDLRNGKLEDTTGGRMYYYHKPDQSISVTQDYAF